MKKSSKKVFEHNVKAEIESGKPQAQALAIAYDTKRRAKKYAKGGMVDEQHLMTAIPPKDETAHVQSPAPKEFMAKKFAEGGKVIKTQHIKRPSMVHSSIIKVKDDDNTSKEIGPKPEEDMVQHPAHLEEDNDQMRPSEEEIMEDHAQMLADGGLVHEMDEQPEPEAEDEMHDSLAAAIMAKRRKMYADGGMVDIETNAEEEPNSFYHQNEDAALKENYDEDMMHMHQPEDSNEHGDMREEHEENEHDMISQIRAKMKRMKPFKG